MTNSIDFADKGRGKKSKNLVDLIYGSPLMLIDALPLSSSNAIDAEVRDDAHNNTIAVATAVICAVGAALVVFFII